MEVITRLSVVLGITLAASIGHAQPQGKVEEAKAHFTSGAQLYDENNFRAALIEFQRAYELAPSYKILFNIGQVQMELQDYAGALKAYSRYLREGGPDVPAERAAEVSKEVERLKGRVGSLTIQSAAGAEVMLDDLSVGFAPLPEPIAVNAGRHTVSVHLTGRDPINRVIDVAGQQQLTVAIANDAAVSGPGVVTTIHAPAGPKSKLPIYVAWTATGALAIGAGVFALIAHSDASDLATLRASYPVTAAQLADQQSKLRTASAIADGLLVATVVAGGFGLYFTLTRSHTSTERAKAVQLHVSPTGAFVTGGF